MDAYEHVYIQVYIYVRPMKRLFIQYIFIWSLLSDIQSGKEATHLFFKVLALCHTVMPERGPGINSLFLSVCISPSFFILQGARPLSTGDAREGARYYISISLSVHLSLFILQGARPLSYGDAGEGTRY